MGMFITELKLENYYDTDWVLTQPLIFVSNLAGKITVPEGFKTDLASVPRIPLIYALWGARSHYESCVHDYLFRSDSIPEVVFKVANKVFLEAMKSRLKPWWIRWPMYWGVCIGSALCFHVKKVFD